MFLSFLLPILSLFGSFRGRKMNNNMEFQIASDLHLEFLLEDFSSVVFHSESDGISKEEKEHSYWSSLNLVTPTAETIALLGDVSVCTIDPGREILESFLRWLCPQFKTVLFLAGNHEYYNAHNTKADKIADVSFVDAYLDSLSSRPSLSNFVFMQRRRVDVQGVAILGATLWSLTPEDVPRKRIEVESFLNDYRLIYVLDNGKVRSISVDDTNAWFHDHRQWIEHELSEIEKYEPNTPVVVLTHHGPTWTGCSAPFFESQRPPALYRSHGFVSDLSSLIDSARNLQGWFYGHTHYNNDRATPKGVLLSSNQRGYVGSVLSDYDPARKYVVRRTLAEENKSNNSGKQDAL